MPHNERVSDCHKSELSPDIILPVLSQTRGGCDKETVSVGAAGLYDQQHLWCHNKVLFPI